jgi:hypothetical protein
MLSPHLPGHEQALFMDTVECRSDSDYAERPLALTWQGRRFEIAEIVATWRGPGEKGFRVKTVNGLAFDLTFREVPDEWQVQPI